MKKQVYKVKGFLEGIHDPEKELMIDQWASLNISLADFKETVFDTGIPYAAEHGVKYWIVDNGHAIGQYSEEVRDFAETHIAPGCIEIGIQIMFIVVPNVPESRLSAKEISAINASQKGMLNIEVASVQDVYDLIDEISLDS